LLTAAASALGGAMAPISIPHQVAGADLVFVGKVTAVAADTVPAAVTKGDTRPMRLATVAVSAAYLGGVGKTVEVGFFPPPNRRPGVNLSKGQEALFFLRKHPTRKNTYLADSPYSAVLGAAPAIKDYVSEAKALSALLADPMKSLEGKDKATAAGLLVTRYRTAPVGAAPKTEAVPAAESKLILAALADADWKVEGRGVGPANAFSWLDPQPADGWTPPKDMASFGDAARKWLRDNAGKYKMRRHVRAEGGPAVEP